jgi:hypothetical protein
MKKLLFVVLVLAAIVGIYKVRADRSPINKQVQDIHEDVIHDIETVKGLLK